MRHWLHIGYPFSATSRLTVFLAGNRRMTEKNYRLCTSLRHQSVCQGRTYQIELNFRIKYKNAM